MTKIHIDFETRSRVDIWEVGAWAYSVHPSTEILCMAYAVDDFDPQIINAESLKDPNIFEALLIEGYIYVAHNAFFEQCIWENILTKRYGRPRIPLRQWRCTLAKSLASAYPASLEKACIAVNTAHQKSMGGKSIMLRMCKPNKEGGWNESEEDFEKLYQYCIEDVLAERDLDNALVDLSPAEQIIWQLDQYINKRGIRVDPPAVRKALQFIDQYSDRLNKKVSEITNGVLDGVSRRQAVLDWCASKGVEISGYTKTDVSNTLSNKSLPQDVKLVLESKMQLGKTSTAKYEVLKQATTEDDRIRDTLQYHGATTGRWTGKLFQLQNLPKGEVKDTFQCIEMLKDESLEDFELFYPDVMGALSSCIRGMLIASPGTELYVGDYSAIEARIVMWHADEQKGLQLYINGEDIYAGMAQKIYGKKDIDEKERELGKTVILGCGFGMSAAKFNMTCATRGIHLSEIMSTKAVEAYRTTYPKIKELWYKEENAAIEAVKTKLEIKCGKVTWKMRDNILLCILPSGRALSYPEPDLTYGETPWGQNKLQLAFMAVNAITKKWERERTYGARLVENIVQATARDILAAALLRLERNGFPVIFHVHDEIVCELSERQDLLNEFKVLMEILPDWAESLPIKAECWKGERYRK